MKRIEQFLKEEMTLPKIRFDVSELLSKKIGTDLKIEVLNASFVGENELYKDIEKPLIVKAFKALPIETPIYLVMSLENIKKLVSPLLNDTLSEELQMGFYEYLVLEAVSSIQELPIFKSLSFQMVSSIDDYRGKAFSIDLKVGNNFAKVLLPLNFKQELEQKIKPTIELNKELPLTLSLECGEVTLEQTSLQNLKVGSFVLLDKIFIDLGKKEGLLNLTLNNKIIFKGQLEGNQFKIVELPKISEETSMENNAAVTLKNIEIPLKVELARLNMTVEEISQLAIGSLIELPIVNPEKVSLTANGKKIGSGEILFLGEKVGIRITEINNE